jgi:hypothetical protein
MHFGCVKLSPTSFTFSAAPNKTSRHKVYSFSRQRQSFHSEISLTLFIGVEREKERGERERELVKERMGCCWVVGPGSTMADVAVCQKVLNDGLREGKREREREREGGKGARDKGSGHRLWIVHGCVAVWSELLNDFVSNWTTNKVFVRFLYIDRSC